MNHIHLIGNLARDPELTTTPSGISVCKFSLAVSRKFSNSEDKKETDFINIVAWRERGESCAKFLSKGKKCYVGGSLQLRTYEDKEGVKRTIAEIVADEVQFLSPKDNDSTPAPQPKLAQPRQSRLDELEPINDQDLPF